MSTPGPAAGSGSRAGRPAVVAVTVATLLVVLPALRPGYLLTYDMVFVPRLPFTADLLGLGTRVPRAVPSDLLVALASRLVSGDIVQKLIVVAVLVAAGIGAARLAPVGPIGRAAAGIAYLWNPYVYERLVIGHWALLLGYAALPWVAAAGAAVRRGDRDGWPRLLIALGAGSLGGASAWLLMALVAPLVVGWPAGSGWRRVLVRLGGVGAALLVLAVPWAVPSLLRPAGVALDPDGDLLFAARADTALGTLGSLITGGGIWNADVSPPGRMSLIYAAAAAAMVVVSVTGLWLLRKRWPVLPPLLAAAVIGLVLAVASTTPPLRAIAHALPGGGLLRDAHKFVAIWVLLASVGFGAVADLATRRPAGRAAAVLGALLAVTPIAVLPAMAWGAAGRLQPVQYPAGWSQAVVAIEADGRSGAVLVLPWQPYRRYSWNGDRVMLDPAPRWFGRQVISSDALPVRVGESVRTVAGDDPLAARFDAPVRAPETFLAELRRAGVAYVVVDGPLGEPGLLRGLRKVGGETVVVYAVDGSSSRAARMATDGLTAPRAPVIAADIAWAWILAVSLCLMGYRRIRRLIR